MYKNVSYTEDCTLITCCDALKCWYTIWKMMYPRKTKEILEPVNQLRGWHLMRGWEYTSHLVGWAQSLKGGSPWSISKDVVPVHPGIFDEEDQSKRTDKHMHRSWSSLGGCSGIRWLDMSLDINNFKSKGQTYRVVPDGLFKKFIGFSFGRRFISPCKECQGAILCSQWIAIPWKIIKEHSGHRASWACKLRISTKYCCTSCSNIGLTSGINREKITTYTSS